MNDLSNSKELVTKKQTKTNEFTSPSSGLKSGVSFQLAITDSSQIGSLRHFDNPKSKDCQRPGLRVVQVELHAFRTDLGQSNECFDTAKFNG